MSKLVDKLVEMLDALQLAELFGSKKFKVMLSTVLFIATTSLIQTGFVTQEALQQIFTTVAIYLGIQGFVDYGKARNGS